jgi:hypothetical protein
MAMLLLLVDEKHPINSRTAEDQWILFDDATGIADVVPHGQHRIWVLLEEMGKMNCPVNIRCADPSPDAMFKTYAFKEIESDTRFSFLLTFSRTFRVIGPKDLEEVHAYSDFQQARQDQMNSRDRISIIANVLHDAGGVSTYFC